MKSPNSSNFQSKSMINSPREPNYSISPNKMLKQTKMKVTELSTTRNTSTY